MYVAPPPKFPEDFLELDRDRQMAVFAAMAQIGDGEGYVHWDKLRHLDPPQSLSAEEWWFAIKAGRNSSLRTIPLVDTEDNPFSYAIPDDVFKLLHYVDQRCSGEIAMAEVVTADEQARSHYLVNSLMEEAIRSSQLEGAATSRQKAKEMLRSGRDPKDRSERMILNNYRALEFMRNEMGKQLTPALVLQLHRIITDGTLDDPDAAGRLQRPEDERVAIIDERDETLLHAPPPAGQLPDRLAAMCKFANEPDEVEDQFMHPVIRGILLHFWLAYDHPFEDGNGRTARAIFYWFMRARGYWLVEYLSISAILHNAPGQYKRAYLMTETDGGDTTYFLLHQLRVIREAIERLHAYLERKIAEVKNVESLVKRSGEFNHRQLEVLSGALRNPGQTYTLNSHAASHRVTHETARTDLSGLVRLGLFGRQRPGRQYEFAPLPDLAGRLERL